MGGASFILSAAYKNVLILFLARKSQSQKTKERENSDAAFVKFYFALYLEKHGINRKMLQRTR